MKLITKITSLGLGAAMLFSLAACGRDYSYFNALNNGPGFACVSFDKKKFDVDDVTATLYFGDYSVKDSLNYWDKYEYGYRFYSQGFFCTVEHVTTGSVLLGAYFEDVEPVMQQIDEMPLGTIAENIFTENLIYLVHHEKEDVYRSGEYGVDTTLDPETDYLTSVYFHHSQNVKIPAELFTEDEGAISFIYYTVFAYDGGYISYIPHPVFIDYTKKKGKIYLRKSPEFEYERIKVDNLEK